MLQIRKIREFIPKGETDSAKYDKPLDPDLVFKDIKELLSALPETIEKVPTTERYNLYVTLWEQSTVAGEREKKVWSHQDLLMFDIDGIDAEARDAATDEAYLNILAKLLNVSPNAIVQIFSGGGYHFLVRLKAPIKDADYFKSNQIYYQVLCSRINDALRDKGLMGEADANVFAPNRMFRLPLTQNIKPNRPKIWVKLLQGGTTEPQDIDLQKISGLPLLTEKDFMSERELSYIKVDSATIPQECEFLKWTYSHQQEMSEPQWYAMLSIVGRLDKGKELVHDYSRRHPSYSATQTDRKTEQSIRASGPRTCESINTLWGNCKSCPHYKKLRSPISIKGEDFIATEHSGFHAVSAKGKLSPQYDDLRKYYGQATPYKNIADIHYRYINTCWEDHPDVYIDNFAEKHFYPKPGNTMRNEFRGKVKCTNLEHPDFFTKTTHRKLNLANGVLNIDTRELHPHDPSFGFKATLPFNYDPKASCPTFQKMLESVTCGDVSMQRTLLQYFGYCISNDEPRADKILVLTGEGQNGKSRFINVVRAIGGCAVTNLGVRDIQNPFHLQKLDGALFNILEEVPSFTDKNFWETMKSLIAGGSATVSRKFKDAFDFSNKAKFIMTCNELPKGATPNHGYFRRLLIVPFNATFSHEAGNIDVTIDSRVIANELPGVLNLLLDGYDELVRNEYQFPKSEAVAKVLEDYKSDLDPVTEWINDTLRRGAPEAVDETTPEWLVLDGNGTPCVDVEELRKNYAAWAESVGEKPVDIRLFCKRLYTAFKSDEVKAQDLPSTGQILGRVVHCRIRLNGARRRLMYGVTFFA